MSRYQDRLIAHAMQTFPSETGHASKTILTQSTAHAHCHCGSQLILTGQITWSALGRLQQAHRGTGTHGMGSQGMKP